MEIKYKRLSEKAVAPVRAHKHDAGFDLTVTRITTELNECGQLLLVYHTDLAFEIPDGYYGQLMTRSSICKKSLRLTTSSSVIDSNYRGEITAKFVATTDVVPAVYREGERFAQLLILPVPEVEFVESDTLSESERGTEGFGSTGNNSSAANDTDTNKKEASDNTVSDEPAVDAEATTVVKEASEVAA